MSKNINVAWDMQSHLSKLICTCILDWFTGIGVYITHKNEIKNKIPLILNAKSDLFSKQRN